MTLLTNIRIINRQVAHSKLLVSNLHTNIP